VQYDQAVGDLVGYLQWMAEPAQNTRVRVGVWVLLFLLVFTVHAWRLNAFLERRPVGPCTRGPAPPDARPRGHGRFADRVFAF
jgi:hypothetical protein